MYLLGHHRTAARPKCWRSTMDLSSTCPCDVSNIIWKPFTWLVRWLSLSSPAPKAKIESSIFAWGQHIHSSEKLNDFDFFIVRSEVSFRVCALLSVSNLSLHYPWTNQEEGKDDPEVDSAIVPEISVKKINQVVVTRHSVPSETAPVSEDLIHYPPLSELSFKKYIYKLIQIITMENFFFWAF